MRRETVRKVISGRELRAFDGGINPAFLAKERYPFLLSLYNACILPSGTMRHSFSFSFLLTTLLFALTQVEAHPTKRAPGLVTVPLKRVVHESDDHSSVVSSTLDLFLGRNRGADYASPSVCNGILIMPTAVTR